MIPFSKFEVAEFEIKDGVISLPLDAICIEPTLHPRSMVDWRTTYNYYLALRSGAKFPLIVVTKLKDRFIVVDGVHRYRAISMLQKLNKVSEPIQAEIIECKNLDEAYLEAVKRNIKHGRPLSIYEKIEIRNRLFKMGWKDKPIAQLLQMPQPNLEGLVEKRVIKKGNELVTLKAPLKHLDSTIGASMFPSKEAQKIFAANSQLTLVNQVVAIIEQGWLAYDDKELLKALKRLKETLNTLEL